MGALSRLVNQFREWGQRREAVRELEDIGRDGRKALARDVGINADALERLVSRGPGSAAGLHRLLEALGLDAERVAKTHRAVARDMELVCSECRFSSRCARDLDAGRAELEYETYCPNTATLAALSQAAGSTLRVTVMSDNGGSSLAQAQWGFLKQLDRAARSWPMAKRVERQARLMGAMMERVGVDPGAAAREGRGIAFAAASRRCLACSNSDACERWLDQAAEDAPPAFCPNAGFLNRTRGPSGTAPSG